MIKLTKGGIIPKDFVGVIGPKERIIGYREIYDFDEETGWHGLIKRAIYSFDVEVVYDNRSNITLSFDRFEYAQNTIDEIYSKINKS